MNLKKSDLIFILLVLLLAKNCFAGVIQTTLPLKFFQNLPSANIEIQGKTIPLLFDTGASKDAIVLSPLALKGLKVRFINEESCGSTSSGKVCMRVFIIPQLKIGDFTVYNVKGELMRQLWGGKENSLLQTRAAQNGVIGLKLLQQFGVLIDYLHAQVILTKDFVYPEGYEVRNWQHVDFIFKDGISTQAFINGSLVRLIWDTGAVPSVIKTSANVNGESMPCSLQQKFDNSNCRYLPVSNLIVAGQSLGSVWFLLQHARLPFDGLIGSNFFAENIVFINFQNNMLAIGKNFSS